MICVMCQVEWKYIVREHPCCHKCEKTAPEAARSPWLFTTGPAAKVARFYERLFDGLNGPNTTKERLAKVFSYTDGILDRKDVGICLENMESREVNDLFGFIGWAVANGKHRAYIMTTVGHDIGLFIAKLRDGVDHGSTPRTGGYGKFLAA